MDLKILKLPENWSISNCDYITLNKELWETLHKEYPKQCDRVLQQPMCDIEPDFLGFIDKYYHLSKIMPLHFTIIDFGCSYAPQAYYFRKHKQYIGIDFSTINERFSF